MSTSTTTTVQTIDRLLIGGRWSTDPKRRTIDVLNPATERLIGRVPEVTLEDVDAAVAAARRAFDYGPWPTTTPAERASVLMAWADRIDARAAELIETDILDLGTPRAFARGLAALTTAVLRDYAAQSDALAVRMREERDALGQHTVVVREPVGVVVCIVPWNGPVFLTALKLGAALMAGCTAVVKVDPLTPLGPLALAEEIAEAGLPEGVVSFLPGGGELGAHLVAHPDVNHVSFTGSTPTGKKVMAAAAQNLTRLTLELGGKSACIIREDAEPDEVLPILTVGCLGMSGQICTTLSRVLIPASRYDEWESAIADLYSGLTIGDPNDEAVAQGPLSSPAQLARTEQFVQSARDEGARIVVGGARPDSLDRGWWYKPTLIADVRPDMRVVREEVFGPVTVLLSYEDLDEAIHVANDTPYGLASAVMTKDEEEAYYIAARLRAGSVAWNGFGSCMAAPSGGFKHSGLGREGGIEGIEAFLETKQITRGAPL